MPSGKSNSRKTNMNMINRGTQTDLLTDVTLFWSTRGSQHEVLNNGTQGRVILTKYFCAFSFRFRDVFDLQTRSGSRGFFLLVFLARGNRQLRELHVRELIVPWSKLRRALFPTCQRPRRNLHHQHLLHHAPQDVFHLAHSLPHHKGWGSFGMC